MPSLAALRPASAAVLVVVIVLAPLPASAWRVRVPHTVSAGPIALEGNGDIFAVLGIPVGPHAAGVAVAKLAAADGREHWRRQLRGAGHERSDFLCQPNRPAVRG